MTVLEITSYGRNTLRRLRQEARIIDPTLMPDLAPAYELDRCAATPTLVTEDLPNVTLDDLVSVSPLPAAAALHALQDVAATLEAMHASGLVHGELRPSTVYILPDGRAALARPDAEPPAREADREAGLRADIHDFAILAFELLTGVHPLTPHNAVAMANSLPMLPRAAAHVLELALTIDVDRRPLPHALMVALDAIPAEAWPTNGLHRPPTRPQAPPIILTSHTIPRPKRAEPTPLAPPVEPEPADLAPMEAPPFDALVEETSVEVGPVEVRIVPARPRRSLFRRILGPFVIFLGLATVFSGGAAGAWLLFSPSPSAGDPTTSPPLVRRISLSVTPPQAQCPYAALHVSATIVTDGGPGELELQWRLPDGSTADTHSFSVDGGRRMLRAAIDLTLRGRDQLLGEVIAVVSPTGSRASVPIRYLCPSAVKKEKDRSRAM